MQDTYIVSAKRTPLGSFGGALKDVTAPQLAASVIEHMIKETKIPKELVDEIILGQVLSGGTGQAPARQAARQAGLPDTAHALTINKVCGSGLKAVMMGADSIALGNSSVVIAGGMENMSMAPYFLSKARYGYRMGSGEIIDAMMHDGLLDPYSGSSMGVIAEGTAQKYQLSQKEQDDYALLSYQRAQRAVKEQAFDHEIAPLTISNRKGEQTITTDEEPFKVDFDKLPELKPVFLKDGTITAGNASTISDGAAVCLLASESAINEHNLKPIARLVSYATHSIDPNMFAEAPIGAMEKACQKAGLSFDQIDLFEINEAFAVVPLCVSRQLRIDHERLNVNGGAIALGHPLGASGARIVTTLLAEMSRREARLGMASLCIGGGEGVAAIFERV